jgi:hypothetical protein
MSLFLTFNDGCCLYGRCFLVFLHSIVKLDCSDVSEQHATRVFWVTWFCAGEWLTFHVIRSHRTAADDCSYDMIYDMIWYDMIWYMIWYDVVWHYMIWYDMMIYDMTWYDMIWYGMIWYDMIYDMTWYDIIWYGMIWYDIWYDMVWHDMIWYDMIWYDMLWYDMIWYDLSYDVYLLHLGFHPLAVVGNIVHK